MSVTKRLFTDETGQMIVSALEAIANKGSSYTVDWDTIHRIARAGKSTEFYEIGGQFVLDWKGKSGSTDTQYAVKVDVGTHRTVTLEDGSTTASAMGLVWHNLTPYDIPFDAREALIGGVALTAGTTYCFTVANQVWYTADNGKVICFTPSVDIPATAMGVTQHSYNATMVGTNIIFYPDGSSDTVLDTCVLSEGSGTSLGTSDGTSYVNHMHRAIFGSNRWKDSALRQWMNSDGDVGAWWVQQHKWDRHPSQSSTIAGMLYGIDPDFLRNIVKVKVVTGNSSAVDGGTLDTTYDRFFPLALEENNINPQISGEGSEWEYFTALKGSSGNYAQYGTYAELAKTGIDALSTARYQWLRSCNRGLGSNAWNIYPSGLITYSNAYNAYRVAPACFI